MTFGASDPLTLPRSYRAVQCSDGTVRVPGCPIFGENRRVSPSGDLAQFGCEWLQRAVLRDRKMRSTGYKAPLHFGHHEPGVIRDPAGYVELDDVALRWYDGELAWIMFGTLIFKSYKDFQRAKDSYPYRSVEISHEKPDEINSLALLDTEAPFFRFPLMKFSASGSNNYFWRHKLLMSTSNENFGVTRLPGLPAPPKEKVGGSIKEADVPGPAPVKDAEGKNPAPNIKSSADFAGEGDDGATSDPAAGGMGGQPDLAARMDRLEAMVMKLCSPMQAAAPPGLGGEQDGPMAGPQKKVPIVSASAVARLEGMFAAQAGAISKLEKELAARDTRDAQFASLKAELLPYEIPNLDLEIKTRIKDGTIQGWSSAIKQFGRKGSSHSEAPTDSVDPVEVAKYAEQGPAVLSKARELYKIFSASPKKSLVRNHGLAAFLSSNVTVEE